MSRALVDPNSSLLITVNVANNIEDASSLLAGSRGEGEGGGGVFTGKANPIHGKTILNISVIPISPTASCPWDYCNE